MAEFKVLVENHKHAGKQCAAGDIIELSAAKGARLAENGVVRAVRSYKSGRKSKKVEPEQAVATADEDETKSENND